MDWTVVARDVYATFVRNALDPLRHFHWETGALLVIVFLLLALIVTFVLRYSWTGLRPTFGGMKIKGHHHSFGGNLRISANRYLRFKGRDPARVGIRGDIARADIANDANKFYVVTVVERSKRRVVLYKEMCIQPGQAKGHLQDDFTQFDQADLTEIRLNNGFDDDDEPGTNISGEYDVYVRPVSFVDVRHWLMHPQREVRIAVWVTLITTGVPLLIEMIKSL